MESQGPEDLALADPAALDPQEARVALGTELLDLEVAAVRIGPRPPLR